MRPYIALILALAFASVSVAGTDEPLAPLRAKLEKLLPGAKPDSIKATPVPGIYEVAYGSQLMYFSADGRYMFTGSLFDLDTRQDLTEQTRAKLRLELMSGLSEDDMIIYTPPRARHTITVFTDPDCPYCRKLHSEMNQFMDLGIRVRYLAFPRTPPGSPSFNKSISIWCAEDRNKALDMAKRGEEIESRTCDNPVKAQVDLGREVGVNGTPAIVLENGEMIPGYQPAKNLARLLDEKAATGSESAAAR